MVVADECIANMFVLMWRFHVFVSIIRAVDG